MKKWLGLVVVVLVGLVFYALGWTMPAVYPAGTWKWAPPRSPALWAALGATVLWDALLWYAWYASRARRARTARRARSCLECGYNLTGNVSGRCPECGHIVLQKLCGEAGDADRTDGQAP